MLARFFIDRPIFAWVISIVIVLGGLAAQFLLPVAQYPEITPPTVQVTCQYPGASATVVQDTVAAPIEQQVNGVENMLYMSSQCTNDGSYVLTVTFALGTNLDMAQVLVQNRVSWATPLLPDVVKATGVVVKKRSPSILLVVNLFAEDNPATGQPFYDQLYLSNYATIQIRDELARIDGVGDVSYLGQQDYSMRVWVDPEKLASRSLTADDVVAALREQNVQVAAGQIGQQPVPTGQDFQYVMTTLGRLTQPEQFADIIIKTGLSGEVTRLRDVGRIELGAKNQDTRCRLDGKSSVGLATFQLPGSNALDVAERIKAKMQELRPRFPTGLEYAIVYDTTPFVEESVHEVFKTLRDAVILVALVVLVFLQDWKAVILPLIDVGVSLIGTFAIMAMMGFSLNNLTLFGLVLAIGIVVDDAIVVLENIERWLAKGYPVREATIHAMEEITGPIIGITLVLCSVFLPSAFLGGITGQFYRQFALTIAASMLLSATNAMTMTPARATAIFGHRTHLPEGQHGHDGREALPWWGLAAIGGLLSVWLFGQAFFAWFRALRPDSEAWLLWVTNFAAFLPGAAVLWWVTKPINKALAVFFRGFNWVFDRITDLYGRTVARCLRLSAIVLILYVGLLGLTYFGFVTLPKGFIPAQDKGYLVVNVQLPDAASLERTTAVVKKVEKIARENGGVAHTVSADGMSFVQNSAISSNFGSCYVVLKEFGERRSHEFGANAIEQTLRKQFYDQIPEADVSVFGAPAVDGLGNAGGFKLMVQDRGDNGLAMLQGQTDNLIEKGKQEPIIAAMFTGFRADTPQLYIDIDRTKCKTMGVPLSAVFDTLQVYMGGYYANDFNNFGRTWQVNIQADSPFRLTPEAVALLKVRNAAGQMIPLGTIAQVRDAGGPVLVTRYNMYPAAAINGGAYPGVSTGTVISVLDALAERELPTSMTSAWTELTYLQTLEGSSAIFAFVGAVVLVFLVLAAQYESWSLPLAVILVVPMCLLCALIGVFLARMDINIFVQVGFVVLVGLASKNAILVVEFARDRQLEGVSAFDATVEAAKARLRAIIMTSFAFILGVVPLMLGHGAGAEMRQTLGTAVFSGMLGVTLFGIFLTPVFYYVIAKWTGRGAAKPGPAHSDHPAKAVEPPSSSAPA
ncbi:MAG: efflux RND transporter permease subunit [Pirellulales bacterium]